METVSTSKESLNLSSKKMSMWQFLLLDIIYLIIFGELILLTDKFTPYRQIGLMGISDILTIAFALVIHIIFLMIGFVICLNNHIHKKPQFIYLKKLLSVRFISFLVFIHFGLIIEVFFRLNNLFFITAIIYSLSFISFYISVFFGSGKDIKTLDQT